MEQQSITTYLEWVIPDVSQTTQIKVTSPTTEPLTNADVEVDIPEQFMGAYLHQTIQTDNGCKESITSFFTGQIITVEHYMNHSKNYQAYTNYIEFAVQHYQDQQTGNTTNACVLPIADPFGLPYVIMETPHINIYEDQESLVQALQEQLNTSKQLAKILVN